MKISDRLGDISEDQFQLALNKFNLGELINVKSIPYGNFGQNVFLTSTKGEFVLRGKPHYLWQFKCEKFFADLIHFNSSVPTPWPYLLDEEKEIFGWSYLIMPKLPGIQLADEKIRLNLNLRIRTEICRSVAQNLAKIHKINWKISGYYNENIDTIEPLKNSWQAFIAIRIRNIFAKAQSHNDHTTKEDLIWVENLILENINFLNDNFTPSIVFQDYREGNMNANKIHDNWQITGIFDLMELYMADAEISLSRSIAGYKDEKKELISIFLKEYFSHSPKRKGFEKRFPIYMLLDRLIIWEWRQRKVNVWWNKNLSFREWCEPYLKLDEMILHK